MTGNDLRPTAPSPLSLAELQRSASCLPPVEPGLKRPRWTWGAAALYPWLSWRLCHFSAKEERKKKSWWYQRFLSALHYWIPKFLSCILGSSSLLHLLNNWGTCQPSANTTWVRMPAPLLGLTPIRCTSRYSRGPMKPYARRKKKKEEKEKMQKSRRWADFPMCYCPCPCLFKREQRSKFQGVFLFKGDKHAWLSVAN